MRGDGEGQPHIHAAAVVFDGRIEKLFHLGKGHDLIELPPNLRPVHAKNRAVEEDILARGQLGVKSSPDFQQAGHASSQTHPALARFGDAAQDFQQGALARAVAPDNPHHFALLDFEGNISERPKIFHARAWRPEVGTRSCYLGTRSSSFQHSKGRGQLVGDDVAQGHITPLLLLMGNTVAFAEVLDLDDGVRHGALAGWPLRLYDIGKGAFHLAKIPDAAGHEKDHHRHGQQCRGPVEG